MENKKYIDADTVIIYLNGLKEIPGVRYGEKKMLEEIISFIQNYPAPRDSTPAGLDWRSPDVWPRKEEADKFGFVLAVNKTDARITSCGAATIIRFPESYYCWAPMPKIPDGALRPQGDKDGQD